MKNMSPANPPPNKEAIIGASEDFWSGRTVALRIDSYVAKYTAWPTPSLAIVGIIPLYNPLTPNSLTICFPASIDPL